MVLTSPTLLGVLRGRSGACSGRSARVSCFTHCTPASFSGVKPPSQGQTLSSGPKRTLDIPQWLAHPKARPLIYSSCPCKERRALLGSLWGLVFCHFFQKLLCHSPTVGLKCDERRIWLFSCYRPKQSYLQNTCSLLWAFLFLLLHPFKHQKSFPIVIFFPADFPSSGSEWVLPLFPHMLSLSFNQSHFLISHLITQVLPGPQPPSELAQAGAALTKWHQSVCTLNWSCLPAGDPLIPSISESTGGCCAHVTEAQERRLFLPLSPTQRSPKMKTLPHSVHPLPVFEM